MKDYLSRIQVFDLLNKFLMTDWPKINKLSWGFIIFFIFFLAFLKPCHYEVGDGKPQPSTLTNQQVRRSPSTSIHPSSSFKPIIHSQHSTSNTIFDATTNNTTTPSSSSTELGTSTTFQNSNLTGMAYKLICKVVEGV